MNNPRIIYLIIRGLCAGADYTPIFFFFRTKNCGCGLYAAADYTQEKTVIVVIKGVVVLGKIKYYEKIAVKGY